MNHIIWDKYEKIYAIYEEKYNFKFCEKKEIQKVIEFIDTYWQKGHILTKSKELLDWQYLDEESGRYNFALAIDKNTKEIHALLGFIISSKYDRNIKNPIRWGSIWKMREDIGYKGLGISVKYFLEKNVFAPYVGGIGLSYYSKTINKKLGEEVGTLKLYYMLNKKKENYKLVGNITDRDYPQKIVIKKDKILNEIDGRSIGERSKIYFKYIPEYKSLLYYINRYYNHPIYQYHFTEIIEEKKEIACIIWRICESEGRKAITIVDYIGNGLEMEGIYNELQKMLQKYDAEYISFYELGLMDMGLRNAGFLNKGISDIVIPLYYEPFVKKNVELDYHYYTYKNNGIKLFFKGDADQDRPNQLISRE